MSDRDNLSSETSCSLCLNQHVRDWSLLGPPPVDVQESTTRLFFSLPAPLKCRKDLEDPGLVMAQRWRFLTAEV